MVSSDSDSASSSFSTVARICVGSNATTSSKYAGQFLFAKGRAIFPVLGSIISSSSIHCHAVMAMAVSSSTSSFSSGSACSSSSEGAGSSSGSDALPGMSSSSSGSLSAVSFSDTEAFSSSCSYPDSCVSPVSALAVTGSIVPVRLTLRRTASHRFPLLLSCLFLQNSFIIMLLHLYILLHIIVS